MIYAKNNIIYITKGDKGDLPPFKIYAANGEYELEDGDFLRLTVKKQPLSEHNLLIKETTDAVFSFEPEDTADMRPGQYSADIELWRGIDGPYTLWPELQNDKRYTENNFKTFVVMPEVS